MLSSVAEACHMAYELPCIERTYSHTLWATHRLLRRHQTSGPKLSLIHAGFARHDPPCQVNKTAVERPCPRARDGGGMGHRGK